MRIRTTSTVRRPGWLRLAASAALAASMLTTGCVESTIAAAGMTAGVGLAQGQAESYIRGELKSARMVPIAVARAAVLHVMCELLLTLKEQRQGDAIGFFRAQADGGREIKVYLKADSPNMTRFTIRVGMMGDSAVSRLMMSRIDAALGEAIAASEPGHE